MTPKQVDEDKVEAEVEEEEKARREKDQIGDEKGVQGAEITEEMEKAFIDYAMSVIMQRAIPSVEDGLKPVQRRILYAMNSIGLDPSKPTKKSASVVGEVLGKYHPHGDVAVYDAMVRLAQYFSLRYPLVHGQGNFGSLDGDSAAAMRYCVSGDSLVVTDKGLQRIDSISDKEDVDFGVLSKDKVVNRVSKWFDSGVHETLKLETHKGYNLTGSKNHPVLTLGKDSFGRPAFYWKLLENIKKGDYVVMDRSEDSFWPEEEVSLKSYCPEASRKGSEKILPGFLSNELGFILGSFISEGFVGENKIEFCNSDKKFIEELKRSWHLVFPDSKLHEFEREPSSYGKKKYIRLECHCRQTIKFLRNIGLNAVKSDKKQIPDLILQSPKDVVKSFLKAYFEGDGSISASSRMIELSCCSKSPDLINRLQTLLLRFGIDSTRRYDQYKDIHKLYLRGKRNVLRFYKEIGFFSSRKKKKLETVILAYKKESSLTDFVPFLSDFVRDLAESNFLKKFNFDRYPNMAQRYSAVSQIVKEKSGLDVEGLFEYFLTYEYLFEKVVSVKSVGEKNVYSIKVESDCHSFISGGFISHNTEAKLSKISAQLLNDIEKDTVDMSPTFDNSNKEPETMPGLLPNLFLNGATGIAVGMATNIPPHNLNEICDAIIKYIEKPKVTSEELAEIVTGPDFPTGGYVTGPGIKDIYTKGKGRVIMRAKTRTQEKKGKSQIIITEIPYMVNKSDLIKDIARLATEKKLPNISDLRDESSKQDVRIVVEVKKGANPTFTLNKLYKYTKLQSNFDANILALVGKQPRNLTLRDYVEEYVKYRVIVVTRRSKFELKKAQDRLEIVTGLLKALSDIDKIVEFIKKSKNTAEAHEGLMNKFSFTTRQAKAILETRLQQLTSLEGDKLKTEDAKLKETIAALEKILGSQDEVLKVIKKEIQGLKKDYGDERKSTLLKRVQEISESDLVEKKDVVIMITNSGYIKRVDLKTYREQKRGGSGVTGAGLKDEDFVKQMITCSTHDYALFFTSRGRVYWIKANDVPAFERQSKGRSIVNLLNLRDEEIANVLAIEKKEDPEGFLMFATKKGIVKRLPVKDLGKPRSTGVRVINLPADNSDELINTIPVDEKQEVLLITKKGQGIRFSSEDVRSMGRASYGVKGIELGKGDEVVSVEALDKGSSILTVTEKGYGKRTALDDYRKTSRAGKGIINLKTSAKTGNVVASLSTKDKDSVIATTTKGMVMRTSMKDLRVMGRATQGVKVIKIKDGDKVADVVKVPVAEEEGQQNLKV